MDCVENLITTDIMAGTSDFSKNLKLFTDLMSQDIADLARVIFCGNDDDPEMLWSYFRSQLSKLKKEHCRRYQKYLSDDDENEYNLSDFEALKNLKPH